MKIMAKKSLGQNFLNDNNVLKKIAFSTVAGAGDLIIEIGPGMGALTKYLKQTNSDVLCFEIDERMKEYLCLLEDSKTKIVYGDFLKVNVLDYIQKKYNKVFIIANIPYYISSLIIRKIINLKVNITDVVLLVQKEYADRVCALPRTKEYDSLTVYLNYYYNISRICNVSRNCFTPAPKVDSSVIKLTSHEIDKSIDEEKFMKLVSDSFKFKRKTLKNNLGNYDWKTVEEYLIKNNFTSTARAEELTFQDYVNLTKIL